MRRETVRNLMIAGCFGVAFLAGCSTTQVAKTSGTESLATKAPSGFSPGPGMGGMIGGMGMLGVHGMMGDR